MNKLLRIDPEFKSLIPPLTQDEYSQLEQNILAHQCRDPITLWRGRIVDGHNRYEICTKHGLKYQILKLRLPTREAVKLWILENQLGRRNLTDAMRIELALSKTTLLRQEAKENQIRGKGGKDPINVRKAIAEDVGISERTVQHYMHIKTKGDPKLLEKVMSGEMKIGTARRLMKGQIEVVTTSVEELEVLPLTPEEAAANYARAALGNVCRIDGVYGFFKKYCHCNVGVAEGLVEWVYRQGVRLGRLVA